MAQPKSVLIDIDIRAEDIKAAQAAMVNAQKTAALYTAEIVRIKKEQAEANKALKEGTITLEDYAEGQVSLTTAQKAATKGLQDANKEYQNNKVVVDAAKGSNDQLRAQLSLMTKEYNGLSKEQRENSLQGQKLAASIKGISDKLKENEGAIGDNRRNVGNYAGAMKDLLGQIGGAVPGLGQLGTAFKGVNGVMSANPIGIVVLALSGLVNMVKQNAVVADTLAFAFGSVNKVFGFISDAVVSLVTDFDKLTKALRNPIAFIKELAGGIKQAAAEGFNAAKAMDDLTVSAARTTAAMKANDIQVQALTKSLKDKTKSEQERIAIANKIADLEIQSADLAKKLAEDYLAAEKMKTEGRTLSAEQQAALIKLESDLLSAETEKQIVESQRQTRINILLEKERTEAAKTGTDDRIKEAEREAERMRQIADEFAKERMNELDRRTLEAGQRAVLLRDAGVEEIEIQKYLSEQLMLINRDEQQAILDGKLAAVDAMAVVAKDKINKEIDDERVRAAALLAIDIDLAEARKYLLEQGVIDYAASLEAQGVEDAERTEQIILDKQTQDAIIVDLERQKSEMLISEAQRVADAQKKAQDDAMAAVSGGLGTLGDVLSGFGSIIQSNIQQIEEQARAAGKTDREIARMTKAARKDAHNMAIAAAVVQMLQGGLAAYSSAAATPIIGAALGPIAAAAALAFGAAQVAQISSQKFADGGVLVGPSHAEGGIPVTVDGQSGYEAEGGEIVLTKGVYRDPHLRQMASDINVAAGGVPIVSRMGKFAMGGALGGSATFAARQATASSGMTQQMVTAAMSEAMAFAPAPVVRVSDINRVSSDARRVQVSSELR